MAAFSRVGATSGTRPDVRCVSGGGRADSGDVDHVGRVDGPPISADGALLGAVRDPTNVIDIAAVRSASA